MRFDEQQQREAFEQWYRQYYGHLTDSRTGNRYDYAPVQRTYDGWQAALSYAEQASHLTLINEGNIEPARQSQVPEGYRLVPEVATWDMIIAATETELTDYSVSPDDETRMTTIGECSAVSIYGAMLEAAPAAPKKAV